MKFEEFWEIYIEGEERMDHQLNLMVFSETINEKITEQYDVVDTIINLMDIYERERRFSEFYEFTQVLKTHNKHIFDDAFQYSHGLLIDHFCYQGQREKIEALAEDFMLKPVETFDEMRKSLKKVVFYNDYTELVERWAETTHEQVATSPKLIPGAGSDLVFAKYAIEMERVYHHYCDTSTFDRSVFKERMAKVDVAPQDRHLDLLEAAFVDSLDEVKQEFEKYNAFDQKEGNYYLHKVFMKYMSGKGMFFAVSGELWRFLLEYWMSADQESDIDNYFLIRPKAFYKFVGGKSGMIMDYRFLAAAILWGSTYVYNFLHAVNLIPKEQHEESLAMLQRMQRLFMMGNYQSLWEYDFVHRWEAPEGKSEAVIVEEKAAFERSYELKRDEIPPIVPEGDPELKALQEEFVEKRESLMDRILSHPATPTQPIKAPKKYGRNEKVDVRYTDGAIKRNIKYKKVQKDIEAGKCEIIS